MMDVGFKYRDEPLMDSNVLYKLAYEPAVIQAGESEHKLPRMYDSGKHGAQYHQDDLETSEVKLFR